MNLNQDLLYEQLSQHYSIKSYGMAREDIALKAVLCFERGMIMEDGYVYLMPQGSFPDTVPEDLQCLVICPDCIIPDCWIHGSVPVYLLQRTHSIIEVLNGIQRIFCRFNEWDADLISILETGADIEQMLLISAPILENPVTVVNDRFEILGSVDYRGGASGRWELDDYRSVPVDCIERLRSVYEYTKIQIPYMHDDHGHERVYTVNFFLENEFRGSISMREIYKPFPEYALMLFRHLAKYVQRAFQYRSGISRSSFEPVRKAVKALLDGTYIEDKQMEHAVKLSPFEKEDGRAYYCFVLIPDDETGLGITDYMISSLIERLPECIILPYSKRIVIIRRSASMDDGYKAVTEKVVPMLEAAGFRIGVSDSFQRLRDIRTEYEKACCAIVNGTAEDDKKLLYVFQKQVFSYMLHQAKGQFSTTDLMPSGLIRLMDHDEKSNVSYIETLRSFLTNQMNSARTARELYLHRSSLSQRLDRIFELLGTSLETPDEQLFYRILLRIMEEEEK